MITWLVGENSFEVREALQLIEADFLGTSEHVDGTSLGLADLPDLLMGLSLFATERLVVIRDISQNKSLWEKLPEWLPRVSDAIHIVFIDAKPDKRTTSYKALKAAASVQEHLAWTERDTAKAERWVSERAAKLTLATDGQFARKLVAHVGVEQWQLAKALDTLSLLDAITPEAIEQLIPRNRQENIFQLFETALDGRPRQVADALNGLRLQEDPYGLFALISSQAISLAALTYASAADNPVKDFGMYPSIASKLARRGERIGGAKVARIVELFAQADADLKRSKADPWVLIEQALLKTAQTV